MPIIRPLTDLCDTGTITELCKQWNRRFLEPAVFQ